MLLITVKGAWQMRIKPIQILTENIFMNDYRNYTKNISQFFDYNPFVARSYQNRMKDLQQQTYQRTRLAEVLHEQNKRWDAPEAVHKNIERLKDENSVVIIGGQQAGLLTGPMYTVNKIISIMQMAKQHESKHQVPVLPVFWIAGEDHDFEEINHVFMPDAGRMKKHTINQRVEQKLPVSEIQINDTDARLWLDELFAQLCETEHTKALYKMINTCLDQAKTYVDFFARIIHELFNEEGLILVDSADPSIRQLESDYFVQLIEKQPEIAQGVYTAAQQVKQLGYPLTLDIEQTDAHLFYHDNRERILLVRNESGDWIGKRNDIHLKTKDLLETAKNKPGSLSNNVVTRPLMQDMLFPTLAFIGGPGEINYWSVLKPAFHALNMNMPPVVPRLSFTYIERPVQKALDKFGLTPDMVINEGIDKRKSNWLASQTTPPIGELTEHIKAVVDKAHEPLSLIHI